MLTYFSRWWDVFVTMPWTAIVAVVFLALNPMAAIAQTNDPVHQRAHEGIIVSEMTPLAGAAQATGPIATSAPTETDAVGTAPAPSPAPSRYYVRGGVIFDRSTDTKFGDGDCLSVSPAALYGCGKGIDGTPLGSRGDFGTMTGVGLGIGYVASPVLRFEALLQYRPGFSFQGNANFVQTTGSQEVTAELSSVSGMLAAYLDLPGFGPFRPLLGSGGGLNVVDIEETQMTFPNTTTIVPGGRHVDLAVMMTAGFATKLRMNMTLDLVWRYTDSGFVETGKDTGRVVWRDGRRDPLEIDLAETSARLSTHGLHLSLRYAF